MNKLICIVIIVFISMSLAAKEIKIEYNITINQKEDRLTQTIRGVVRDAS